MKKPVYFLLEEESLQYIKENCKKRGQKGELINEAVKKEIIQRRQSA